MSESSGEPRSPKWLDALIVLACLALVLGFLFRGSLERGQVIFANDSPLAGIQSHAFDEKSGWSFWQDQNWLGGEVPSAMPNFTKAYFDVCLALGGDSGPVLFTKTYAPMALLLLGLSGWLLFRSLRFSQPVCVLGALALALNGDLLTHATWGLPSVALGAAGACLCLAAVFHGLRQTGWRAWAWTVLGGLALGQGVMESFDVGGIFSLCVAAVVFVAVLNRDGQKSKSLIPNSLLGFAKVGVIALAAALMAGHTLVNLFQTAGGTAAAMKASPLKRLDDAVQQAREQIQSSTDLDPFQKQQLLAEVGKQRLAQFDQIRQQQFDAATQWSVPPGETLRLAIPGLYGYRESPHGWLNLPVSDAHRYWGAVGQEPAYTRALAENPRSHLNALESYAKVAGPQRAPFRRHAYPGLYAGLLVLLVVVWALLQSLRKQGVYSPAERRLVWLWAAGALGCLLLAWGHHVPFYQLIYQLPFFDTIRNPIKFMHPMNVALAVLFAYGLEGMARVYLSNAPSRISLPKRLAALRGWNRTWGVGLLGFLGIALLAWIIYAVSLPDLRMHLIDSLGFEEGAAKEMARHSITAGGVALLVMLLAVGWMALMMAGVRAAWVWMACGVLLCADLGRGSAPFIAYFNHHTQYASNDIVRIISQRPYEQRVQFAQGVMVSELRTLAQQQQRLILEHQGTADPIKKNQLEIAIADLSAQSQHLQLFFRVYQTDWKQGLFPWHRVHTIDLIQEPRVAPENAAFRAAVGANPRRSMELTSTRWLLGGRVSIIPELPAMFNTHTNAFHLREAFNLVARPGITNGIPNYTAKATPRGLLALVEFEGALPRAGLYSHWRSGVADETALALLPDPEWDPHREVLVTEGLPAPDSTDANATVIPARYEFYDPKRVVISTDAETSTVLMLNDKHHPAWQVTVDGKPAKLLRANYLMRGVYLSAGKHTVEFRFAPPAGSIRISLAGLGLAGVLGALLIFMPSRRREEEEEEDGDGPEEVDLEIIIPSDDPETPTADETASTDEPPAPSHRKSRSRSGRRRKR